MARASSQEVFRYRGLRWWRVTRVSRDRDRLDGRRRRPGIRLLVVALVLAPVLYSYATTMAKPSSLPLSVRSIEWVRANHGAWLVDTVEHYWYTWTAPAPGGPTLKSLPAVGLVRRPSVQPTQRPRVHNTAYEPARIVPVLHPGLPG